MIRINLKENYLDNEIIEIFLKLATSIVKNLQGVKFELYDDGNIRITVDVTNIYGFLINKNFFKYKYKIISKNHYITDEMIFEWLNLPCGRVISSIISPSYNSNEKYKEFSEKYKYTCIEFFDNLEVFRKKNNRLTEKNKYDFLKKYYPAYSQVVEAFSYNNMLCGENRDVLLAKMNVNVCPYCNMNYTLNYKKKSKNKSSADLDHFYVKSYYPLYALCLYNFIPSCPICNSRLKLDKIMTVETHIYPHENSFADKGFFVISNLGEYMLGICNSVKIEIHNLDEDCKINNSSELFKLEERYKFFEPTAKELLNKVIEYNLLYQEELSVLLGDVSINNIKHLIFGNKLTEEEILNESLGKFKMDLLKDFGVF